MGKPRPLFNLYSFPKFTVNKAVKLPMTRLDPGPLVWKQPLCQNLCTNLTKLLPDQKKQKNNWPWCPFTGLNFDSIQGGLTASNP